MIRQIHQRAVSAICLAGVVAIAAATYARAESVKNIILAEVDPGGANGTVVSFHDELTPEQEAQFFSNLENGLGEFISPVATVTKTSAGVQDTETTRILVVPLDGGAIVVPVSVTCSRRARGTRDAARGCAPIEIQGRAACSAVPRARQGAAGEEQPACSKTESTERSSFLMFGSI